MRGGLGLPGLAQQHVTLLAMWQYFSLFFASVGFIRQPVFERSDVFDPSAVLDHESLHAGEGKS
jgi:hypothetical protein